MRGDLPLPALRLLSSCTVRTHERSETAYTQERNANNVRPVIVGGERYESLTEAARHLKYSRERIRNMIKNKRASYV